MPQPIGDIDHTMIPYQGLRYKGMTIWDDTTVPAFEKHAAPLGVAGKDSITLDTIKTAAEKINARGLSVDKDGQFYAVKKPSQVHGFGNKIKVYSAATLYAAASRPRIAIAVMGTLIVALGAAAIYEGVQMHKAAEKTKTAQ